MSHTVEIPVTLKDDLKNFRFKHRTGHAALVVKIVKASLSMKVEEELLDQTIEEIAEELPENAPRFVVLSHELDHKDGRKSYPLILINWAPSSSPTDLMTLHASSLSYFQQTAEIAKVLEVRDGAEGLTTKAVNDKLLAA